MSHAPLVAIAVCILSSLGAGDVGAAVIGVTTGADAAAGDGECSLREAIIAANTDAAVDACAAGDGPDLILLGERTHLLSISGPSEDAAATGDLDVASEVVIRGAGVDETIIDGGGLDRVLHVLSSGALTIEALTVTGGLTPSLTGEVSLEELSTGSFLVFTRTGGGGISADGPLTVRRCRIEANATGDGGLGTVAVPGGVTTVGMPGGFGAGIVSRATLDISDSTVAHNRAGDGGVHDGMLSLGVGGMGGGIAVFSGAATITRTTIAHNQTGVGGPASEGLGDLGGGGGLLVFSPFQGLTEVTLESSTVVHNRASSEGSPQRGGGILAIGAVSISRSTIAFNAAPRGGGIASSFSSSTLPIGVLGSLIVGNEAATNPDCEHVTDAGGNIFGSGCVGATAAEGFELASLGELGDYGGPTQTLPLLVGSVAIDAGGACDVLDQRGSPRPLGAACDAGAFEWSGCGDGGVGDGEDCDDGGDSATCTFQCLVSTCGDGYTNRAAGEACDDGDANDDNTQGACRTSCRRVACGDGVVDATERCDDGEESATCNRDCTPVVCGDGVTNEAADEACDEGEDNSATVPDACRPGCVLAGCGDGVVDSGEECDAGDANGEGVDDTCRSDCRLPRCGDGVIVGDEACDDGAANADATDACRTSCALPACGDGIVDTGEACDPPEGLFATLPDACRPGCVVARCGDGAIDTGEACDDANDAGDDGCSACVVDSGWRCAFQAGAGSVCERAPDAGDGDTNGGDTSGGDTSGADTDTRTSGNSSGGCAGAGAPLCYGAVLWVLLVAGFRRRRALRFQGFTRWG